MNMIQLPQGGASSGSMPMDQVADLRKALEAGYGTDMSTLTGGGALRVQSLEMTMLSTIQENKHFVLFNNLAKSDATATVDEWTEQSSVGGFLGGSTNSETGVINQATGEYDRRVGMVKYLMTRRQVSFVTTLQGAIADAESVEQQNGALQLLTDAEFLSFEGDSSIVPTEFDGIYAQMVALGSSDHVLDARGDSVASIDLITRAASTIAGYGNFGTPTDMYMSQLVQSDFDANLDPAWRVPLNDVAHGGIQLGSPVKGIRTSWGDIKANHDVFIRDEEWQKPFQVYNSATAVANDTFQPASVTASAAAGSSSQFTAAQAGTYYYAVAGVTAAGQSEVVWSGQVAVAAGDVVTLTITPSSGGGENGYVIYRGRMNGTNTVDDVRQQTRVAKAAGATTTYADDNSDIPGTTKVFILNQSPGAKAINWRQLLPMLKFPLYPTDSAVVPWAQLLFGYLRLGKRKQHVVIKNVVPAGAVWKPFG